MKYYFTKLGDVYPGEEVHEMNFPDHTIVIQRSKIRDYQELKFEDKTLEKISEFGWPLKKDTIVGTLDHEKFKPQAPIQDSDTWEGSFERKCLFIFGAGASANCVFDTDKADFCAETLRPPIGPALFEKRFKSYYERYKGVKQSLSFLQGLSAQNVEDFFEDEWAEVSKNSNQEVLSRHINAQYYLQELLRDVSFHVAEKYYAKNLYGVLAYKLQKIYAKSIVRKFDRIAHKKFAFISFNQDTILEHFVGEFFKKPIKTMDDYVNVNDSPYCIFKPHGSWNWGWKYPKPELFNGNSADWLFENNTNLFQLYYEILGDHITMIDWSTFGHEWSLSKNYLGKFTVDKSKLQLVSREQTSYYYPGLLLPYKEKDEFIMPLRHFYNMRFYLDQIETLIIIGWKGNEAAFNDLLLKSSSGRLKKIIIADPNHKEVCKNIGAFLEKNQIKPIVYNGFEDFILNGLDKEVA